MSEGKSRAEYLAKVMASIGGAWPAVSDVLNERIGELTEQLINNDNEQTRGRIKALREVKDLPSTLRAEFDAISAALADEAAAS